jgi:ABC-type Fe3+ transport system permease subunit
MFVAVASAAAFACLTLEAIVIAIWHIWLSGHALTSWLDQERDFPLIGPSTPLDVAAVLSSLAIGLFIAWTIGRNQRG